MPALVLAHINRWLIVAEQDLAGPFLSGETFTATAAYFFVITSWARFYDISLQPCPRISALLALVGNCVAVRAALHAEGHGMVDVPDPTPHP